MVNSKSPVTTVGSGYCRVALARPVFDTFQYRIPDHLIDAVRPGVRVVVPFGRQTLTGVVWSLETEVDVSRVRDVKEALDDEPVLAGPLIELCRWISRYYAAPPGMVVRAALPPGLLSNTGARATPELRRKVISITERLPTLIARDEAFGRARRQREVYEALEGLGGQAEVSHLEHLLSVSRSVIEALAEKGLEVSPVEIARALVGVGRVDEAFPYLERAVVQGDRKLLTLWTDTGWDALRGDPRFREIQKQLRESSPRWKIPLPDWP